MPIHKLSWTSPKLETRSASRYGKSSTGIFAKKKIRRDELVYVCGGYVMTLAEEQKLPKKLRDVGMQIAENLVLTFTRTSDVDGDFNHSCEPNVGIRSQIFFVAMRDIRKGEELVFDYAMVLYHGKGAKPYRLECKCGAPACRGVITDDDWQRPDLQEKYRGYFQYFLQKKIDRMGKA